MALETSAVMVWTTTLSRSMRSLIALISSVWIDISSSEASFPKQWSGSVAGRENPRDGRARGRAVTAGSRDVHGNPAFYSAGSHPGQARAKSPRGCERRAPRRRTSEPCRHHAEGARPAGRGECPQHEVGGEQEVVRRATEVRDRLRGEAAPLEPGGELAGVELPLHHVAPLRIARAHAASVRGRGRGATAKVRAHDLDDLPAIHSRGD